MIAVLKEMILDFQDMQLETGIARQTAVKPVAGKATVCIGVRRSGKSVFMFQLIQQLVESGVSRKNILYLNFFDDRLHGLGRQNLYQILDAYYSVYPEKKGTETIYCFFDEIQVLDGWEPFVDRLMRTEKCRVYITGSSAQMLSKEIATQMRGRALSWEIFPFSFREFLAYKNIAVDKEMSAKTRLFIQKAFEDYWQVGGFPEVVGLEKQLRIKTHQDYFNTVLFRDLIERHDISHPKAITDLAYRLIDNTASLYTINALTGYLKSLGHKIQKSAVSDYLEWFEDAYFLFTVRIFDSSLARANINPKKIYCIDHAMVTSIASGILVNSGHLLENLVFVALRRCCSRIYYYRTQSSREVDFLVHSENRTKTLVQVCESLTDPKSQKREVAALSDAMTELKLKTGIIVTRNQEQQIQTPQGVISVMPAWRFLLDLPMLIE